MVGEEGRERGEVGRGGNEEKRSWVEKWAGSVEWSIGQS